MSTCLLFEKYLAMSLMVSISCVSDEHFYGSHADCHIVYCVGQSGSKCCCVWHARELYMWLISGIQVGGFPVNVISLHIYDLHSMLTSILLEQFLYGATIGTLKFLYVPVPRVLRLVWSLVVWLWWIWGFSAACKYHSSWLWCLSLIDGDLNLCQVYWKYLLWWDRLKLVI